MTSYRVLSITVRFVNFLNYPVDVYYDTSGALPEETIQRNGSRLLTQTQTIPQTSPGVGDKYFEAIPYVLEWSFYRSGEDFLYHPSGSASFKVTTDVHYINYLNGVDQILLVQDESNWEEYLLEKSEPIVQRMGFTQSLMWMLNLTTPAPLPEDTNNMNSTTNFVTVGESPAPLKLQSKDSFLTFSLAQSEDG